ncbi:hypothetical protein D9758_015513 [Tetrapyrgos nigripes]|uniref:Uncharacterized protein n=1 Tax=Tetrapyrgos nigripes TaxID=182062 RepID=A0A8H5CZG3_9AGAR|nr:hypothetical protein D9758_015513 [Tetrapyrgos nigripes]
MQPGPELWAQGFQKASLSPQALKPSSKAGPKPAHHYRELGDSQILELGLADKFSALAADNTSNNDTLHQELASILNGTSTSTFYNSDNITIHCLPHAIHLAVQAFLIELKACNETDIDANNMESPKTWTEEEAEKVFAQDEGLSEKSDKELLEEQDSNGVDIEVVVQKIRQVSPQCSEAFKKTISIVNTITTNPNKKLCILNLILDVITRWNSTYFMLNISKSTNS